MFLQIVGILLLVPFFGWAVVLLRRRFLYYEENSILVEALTAGGLVLFLWIEAAALRHALGHQLLYYLFALLGLAVAAFALYAHVLISLASRVLVDLVLAGDVTPADQPRFGPVEALERSEDYEGALQEYLVLARIYPRNFEVLQRTARIHELLERPEEASVWYQRARKRAAGPDEALVAVNRLCALYDGDLKVPNEADSALLAFLSDYPDSLDAPVVRDRLERRAQRADFQISAALEALDEATLPQEHAEHPENALEVAGIGAARARELSGNRTGTGAAAEPKPGGAATVNLVSLEEAGASDSDIAPEVPVQQPAAGPRVALERLESAAPAEETAISGTPRNGPRDRPEKLENREPASTLEALDAVQPTEDGPETAPERSTNRPSSLSLEALDGPETG
ncbi:MAG: hypothetical protein KF886_19755 [Candidatus Hydrogenedentes bacterium]|nr:hypothetical protein [Candidatus Hydrogenedentota bacterium]